MAARPDGRRRAVRVRGQRRHRLLVIPAWVTGSAAHRLRVDIVVDPGASLTCLTPRAAVSLGLDLTRPHEQRRLAGLGSATAPLVTLDTLQIGSLVARHLPVAIVALPPVLRVDGLLGLDFCDALGITRLTLELDTATLVLR